MSLRVMALVGMFLMGVSVGAFVDSTRHMTKAQIHNALVNMNAQGCVSGADMVFTAVGLNPDASTANSVVLVCSVNAAQVVTNAEKKGKL